MRMYLISDNIDTYTGMRLSGVEGVVVHEREELEEALSFVTGQPDIGIVLLTEKLGRDFIGRAVDAGFIKDLPEDTDVCGENGEYHTFCYAGGMFRNRVDFILGEPLYRTYPVKLENGEEKEYSYWFADLCEPE